jgi:hypothetical protein
MDAPDGSGGHDKVPGGFENTGWAGGLPKSDVELAARRAATDQAGHDDRFRHRFYCLPTEAQDAYAKVADCCRACPVSFTCKTPRDGTQPRTLPTNRNTTVASRRLEETDGARGRAGAPGTSPRLSGGWLNRGFGRSISRGTEGTQKSRNLLIKAPPIPSGRPRPAVGCAPATHNRRPPREDSVSGGFFRAPSCIGDRHRTRAARSPAYGGRRSDPSA